MPAPHATASRRVAWPLTLAAILVLNIWLVGRLFSSEYLVYMDSVQGFYVALVRIIRESWPFLEWFPYWRLGMPFEATYQPLLHTSGALVGLLTGVSSAQAFHIALASLYCLGPVFVAELARRLTQSAATGAAAGFAYALFSPSLLLVPAIRADAGGWLVARRLHAMLVYGDGPHVAGLTLVPLALICLVHHARSRSLRSLTLCAVSFAAVFLTNIPATIVLALAVTAYLLAAPVAQWRPLAARTAAAAALGYALCCPLTPPSVLLNVLVNTQAMESANQVDSEKALLWLGVFTVATLFRYAAGNLTHAARFTALFAWFTGAVVLGFHWFDLTLIAQPARFHLGMELALILAIATLAHRFLAHRPRIAQACAAALAAFLVLQVIHYRDYARDRIQRLDITSRSEYLIAQWLDRNAQGRRAYVTGATGFWLSAFTNTPHVMGCCDQGSLLPVDSMTHYVIGTDDGAQGREAAVSLAWLQALGAHYIAVSNAKSTDPIADFRHPGKFDGVLEAVFRTEGDVIYRVPQNSDSLAHLVSPAEVVQTRPENGVDLEPLTPYIEAITDPARPLAAFTWQTGGDARITAQPTPATPLISVQVPYHPGWRAQAQGRHAAVTEDALGLLVIAPDCSGPCTVDLTFTGGPERKVTLAVAALAWLLTALIWTRKLP